MSRALHFGAAAGSAAFVVTTGMAGLALAYERAPPHELRAPLHHCFFVKRGFYAGVDEHLSKTCNFIWQSAWPLGINPKLFGLGLRAVVVMAVVSLLFYLRAPIARWFDARVGGRMASLARFAGRGRALRPWCIAFFIRSPALVLMYAAANDAVLVPGFALEPHHAAFFKLAQAILAVLVLSQTALPLCGALLFGTWLYLLAHGWMAAVEAMPLLVVAVAYVSSPWQSHRIAAPELGERAMRGLRIALGVSLIAAGYLTLYDYPRAAGFAEGLPSIMGDPLVRLLMMGHTEGFERETWVASWAMLQISGGALIAIGVFSRATAFVVASMLARLLFVAFGWHEVPRFYLIAAMLVLITSDAQRSELERLVPADGGTGTGTERTGLQIATAAALAAAAVVPMLYYFSLLDRRALH